MIVRLSLVLLALWSFYSLSVFVHTRVIPVDSPWVVALESNSHDSAIIPAGIALERRIESGIIQSCVDHKKNGPAFVDGHRCDHNTQQYRLVWETG